MAKNTVSTRSGLRESGNKLEYEITTTEVAMYLRSKFKMIEDALNAKGYKNVPSIKPEVSSIRLGKHYAPLFVLLPKEVLSLKDYNPDIPSVFQPDRDTSDGAWLKQEYYALLFCYMYKRDDINAFRSGELRRQAGITNSRDMETLFKYSTPKITKSADENGAESLTVILILDPVRVFHDMLTDIQNPKQRFRVEISKTEKIDDRSYMYTVERLVKKKKKEDYMQLEALIRQMKSNRNV